MAIIVQCSNPTGLLASVRRAVEGRRMWQWQCDSEGDFTHTAMQWRFQAWLHPRIDMAALHLGIIGPKGVLMTRAVYDTYHCNFVEMLLGHFHAQFTSVTITAQASTGDTF